MKISLTGFQPIVIEDQQQFTGTELIMQVCNIHRIPVEFQNIFSIIFQKQSLIYERDQIFQIDYSQSDEIIIAPRHFYSVSEDMPIQLIYCITCYQYDQYIVNAWNYTQHVTLQLVITLQIIFKQSASYINEAIYKNSNGDENESSANIQQSSSINSIKPNALQYPIEHSQLFPERLKNLYKKNKDYIYRTELIYFDDFKQLSFKNKLIRLFEVFMKSSYSSFFYYPVLDKEIDWTSLIGIARDGICLLDAEMNLGYLYLPYDLIQKVQQLSSTIIINVKNLNDYERIDTTNDESSTSYSNMKQSQLAKSIAKITQNMEIPIYPKILPTQISMATTENYQQYTIQDNKPLISFQINRTKNMIDEMQRAESHITGEMTTSKDKRNLRQKIVIKFKNENHMQNFLYIFDTYSSNQQANNNRSLRIQGEIQTELLQNVYFNNILRYCSQPSPQLSKVLETINDLYYFKNKKIILNKLEFINEQMHYMSSKAICQSIQSALEYNATNGCIIIQNREQQNIYFKMGEGTPYDPFVPSKTDIDQNILIEKIEFSNNQFEKMVYLSEIHKLLKNKTLQQTLQSFIFRNNLVKTQGCLMFCGALKQYTFLKELVLDSCQINIYGISSLLYFLDYHKVHISILDLSNVKFTTINQIKQLAHYLSNCIVLNGQNFEVLNLSGCLQSYKHVQILSDILQHQTQILYNDFQVHQVIDTMVVKNVALDYLEPLKNICKKIII